jgi:hypothetical protein
MHKAVISVLVALIIFMIGLLIWLPPKKEIIVKTFEEEISIRFEKVEQIIFCKDKYGDIPAIIYRDKETDVRYLYVWFGMANGGPVFTRLWDK